MSTVSFNPDTIQREWFLVDLQGQSLGRVASRVAAILRGKHKPTFTPHADCGDFVVAVNAGDVRLTGNKLADKRYHWHTGYMGGIKSVTAGELMAKDPTEVFRLAVKRMLPKGTLGRHQFKKLKVYAGADHPHEAQQPTRLDNLVKQ